MRQTVWWILLVLAFLMGCGVLAVVLLGCGSTTISLSEVLTQQGEVEGCFWLVGGAAPYVSVTAVVSRGGVPLQQCLDARHP